MISSSVNTSILAQTAPISIRSIASARLTFAATDTASLSGIVRGVTAFTHLAQIGFPPFSMGSLEPELTSLRICTEVPSRLDDGKICCPENEMDCSTRKGAKPKPRWNAAMAHKIDKERWLRIVRMRELKTIPDVAREEEIRKKL